MGAGSQKRCGAGWVAVRRNGVENININVINASGEDAPFNENEFDIIIMTGEVINYTPNPLKNMGLQI
jgi:hypothetical protein